ncbi:polyprenyl synthetase family protein [Candidatus Woesearchaeota archaeon]|nr:polyprenyl synthetase family protein [Candidatus Woesearchaeota archaeon]
MDVRQVLQEYKKKIDSALETYLESRAKSAVSPETRQMIELIKDFNLRGGKRIRPVLCIFGYRCFRECSGDDEKALIRASLAVEMMESFLLIHDDVMDQDMLRRGGPTVHKTYAELASAYDTDRQRFGESMAIIAGDICASLGNDLLAGSSFGAEKKIKVLRLFNDVIVRTCFGQVHDLLSEIREETTEKDIENIHELKTAAYTLEAPLQIGAILAGANEKDLRMLSRFAVPVGKAFQLQDDILGMFGSEQKTGKPVGSDLKEGKRTLLVLKAMEKADNIQKQKLQVCLGNPDIEEKDIREVQQAIRDTGSLDYSRKLAKSLIRKGKAALEESGIRQEAKEFLLSVADYMAEREF